MGKLKGRIPGIALLFIVFLVPLTLYQGIHNYVLIKLSLTETLILLSLVAWIGGGLCSGRDLKLRRTPLDRPLLLFFFLMLLSLAGSAYRWAGPPQIYRLATYFLLYGLTVNILRAERGLNRLVFVWLLSTGLAALYGLYEYFFKGIAPPRSTFGNANFFAAYLVLVFPLALALFIRSIFSGLRKNRLKVLSLAVLLLIMTFSLFLASSRGAWLGLGVGLISLGWLACLRLSRRWIAARLIPACLVLVLVVVAALSPWLLGRKAVQEGLERGTMGLRVLIWEGTTRMIAAHPWLGSGIGSFRFAYPQYRVPAYFSNPHAVNGTAHAHNEFLEVAAETGILGLAAFLGILIVFFRKGTELVRGEEDGSPRAMTMGLISGIAALLATNLVGVNLRFASSAIFLWLAMGLVMSRSPVMSYKLRVTSYGLRLIFALVLLLAGWAGWQVVAKPFLANSYFQKGINYREAGDWGKTISAYKRAIAINPYFVEAYFRLGFAYVSIGAIDKAISAYGRVKELAPSYSRVERNLGLLFFEKKDWKQAAGSLEQSLKLDPEDAEGHNLLGVAYARTGRSREAELEFMLALEINPDYADSYNNLGNVYAGWGEMDKAVAGYRKALELSPGDKQFRENLERASRKGKKGKK